LLHLEDAFDAQNVISTANGRAGSFVAASSQPSDDNGSSNASTTPVNHSPKFSFRFDFQDDLEASRPYRNAHRDSMDFSLRTSIAPSHVLSAFSGLSLGDISNLSVIALPIHAGDITNSCHYGFGGQPLEQPCAATEPGYLTSPWSARHLDMIRHPTSTAKPTSSIEKMDSHNEAFTAQDYDSTWLELLHPLDEAICIPKAE
jgi:hypothetical protein